MFGRSIGFNSVLLGIFALITAGIVAVTFQTTAPRIVESKLRAAQAALFEIVPLSEHNNDLFHDTVAIPEDYREFLGLTDSQDVDKKIHIARRDGVPFAAIIPTTAMDGYSGPIKMIIGVNADGTIAGLRVTDHKETPGLGDYVDIRKSNWVLSFNGKDIGSQFDKRSEVKRTSDKNSAQTNGEEQTFDQLTGATITRTAVIRQVKKTLSFFNIADPLRAATELHENIEQHETTELHKTTGQHDSTDEVTL